MILCTWAGPVVTIIPIEVIESIGAAPAERSEFEAI